jgi:ketosteroid isomerase-like protein
VGRTRDLILRLYGAYRRQDIDEVIDGMHDSAEFRPVPSTRVYHGPDDIRTFFEHDIDELEEFDFRVASVLEQDEQALLIGRYRQWEEGDLKDKSIFWIADVEDGKLCHFDPFDNISDAMAAFKGRLAAG